MWRKWSTLRDKATWLAWNQVASCLGHWRHVPDAFHPTLMMLTDELHVLSHRSNEEEDTLSPSAPHKETKTKILSCPTWETQLLSPEEQGSPSVRWLSKTIGASVWTTGILWLLWLGPWKYIAHHDSAPSEATVQKLSQCPHMLFKMRPQPHTNLPVKIWRLWAAVSQGFVHFTGFLEVLWKASWPEGTQEVNSSPQY